MFNLDFTMNPQLLDNLILHLVAHAVGHAERRHYAAVTQAEDALRKALGDDKSGLYIEYDRRVHMEKDDSIIASFWVGLRLGMQSQQKLTEIDLLIEEALDS